MHEGDLSMTVRARKRFGAKCAERAREIEHVLDSREPIRWMRAKTLFGCCHSFSFADSCCLVPEFGSVKSGRLGTPKDSIGQLVLHRSKAMTSDQDFFNSQLNIQLMPNLSVSIPKRAFQN